MFGPPRTCLGSFKRRRDDSTIIFEGGGAPLPLASRKNIVHMFYDLGMKPKDIAPLIVSPRTEGAVTVRCVERVLEFFKTFQHVEDVLRGPHRRKIPEGHAAKLVAIVTATPWLYLEEISEELEKECGVFYRPGLCYDTLQHLGFSLKVMRRKARQRDEQKRYRYFLALSKVVTRAAQLVFADEVGQDGRGSRRRRGWGRVGQPVEITEYLNRGKHISILALYGIGGFIDFDWCEGGYSADDFMSAVEFMIIPNLRPYPEVNSGRTRSDLYRNNAFNNHQGNEPHVTLPFFLETGRVDSDSRQLQDPPHARRETSGNGELDGRKTFFPCAV